MNLTRTQSRGCLLKAVVVEEPAIRNPGRREMKRTSLVAVGACAVVAVAARGVLADGGSSIANAPELPVGRQVDGGTDNGALEFWRVTLKRADHLRLDFGNTTGQGGVSLFVFSSKVTDYTLDDSQPLGDKSTEKKAELRFVAPTPGRYTVEVRGYCGNCPYSYILTGFVRHYTHLTLSVPRVARAHTLVLLRGRVIGLSSGNIAIQAKSQRGWKTLTLMNVKPGGSFAYKTRVGSPGTYRGRVVFYGDASHLPTSAVLSIKIV
jgi:hypothetical protein